MTPPNRPELEQSILGALLITPKALADVGDVLTEADFYARNHRTVYAAITALDAAGDPVDVMTVSNWLRAQGELDEIGGLPALADLASMSTGAANIRSYAELVRDASLERQVLERLHSAQQLMHEPATTAEKLDGVQRLILDVGSRQNEGPRKVDTLLPGFIDWLDRLVQSKSTLTGLASGFTDLDNMTTGLQAGDLVIVAGRPSMGKTSFAMNIAEHVAVRQDKPALVFSLEMPSSQLLQRMASSLSNVPLERIRSPYQMDRDDWDVLTKATARLRAAPLFIDDQGGLSPGEMLARARRIKQREGCSLIVVDYLQLMQVHGFKSKDNRTAEISEISRSLKRMAKELQVPVIALSQLNRSLEQRQNKRPIMSDLRESGAIEQDADLILFAYRDEVYHEAIGDDARRGVAELIIGKQRNGPIGKVLLTFQGQYVRFRNIDDVSRTDYEAALNPKQPQPARRYAKAGFDA